MSTDQKESFLRLVKLGIGHTNTAINLANIDWVALKALADRQGLSAIVLDGLNVVRSKRSDVRGECFPSQQFTLQWIGEVMQNYEQRYVQYGKAIGYLAEWYKQNGYKMMVLKGYASALDWPNPKHRPCGDVDIWLFGKQKEADATLASWLKNQGSRSRIDNSHHHHTVFDWCGFSVENHYDFVNVYAHKSSAELEKVFKELGEDDSHFVEIFGEKVYLPTPNLHALFLIRHMASHFASAEITLRQVLDWAFFVEKHTEEVGWKWLDGMLEKFHMKEFVSCINAICVEDLGFSVGIFPAAQFVPDLKKRVLEDILDPDFSAAEPTRFLPRVIYKYKRWHGNAWKQELCYSESRWSAFRNGVWAHLLKPKSI